MTIRYLVLPLALCAGIPCYAGGPQGVRFNTAGVLDLATRTRLLTGKNVPAEALEASAAQQILAAPVLDQEHATLPFPDYAFGCAADSKTCVPQHEQKLIAASTGAVKRENKRLSVKSGEAPAAVFVDWLEPTTKTADGDSETHWYLGALPGSGFRQVEVQFGHDAPGSFLMNPKSGKTAFVHSGSDIVALSPDGLHLVTFNADNPPLTLRVAALDEAGPRLELECVAGNEDRSTAQFKGWHDAHGFDLVVETGKAGAAKPMPLRLQRGEHGWSLATPPDQSTVGLALGCRSL